MSRREERDRIRRELADARYRRSGAPDPATGPVPLLDVVAARIAEVSPDWRALVAPGRAAAGRAPHGMGRELALGVELIYEGWLLHAGSPRLVALPQDGGSGLALLVGDWCYAAGLCEVAEDGDLAAVRILARLVADLSAGHGAGVEALEARWDEVLAELAAQRG